MITKFLSRPTVLLAVFLLSVLGFFEYSMIGNSIYYNGYSESSQKIVFFTQIILAIIIIFSFIAIIRKKNILLKDLKYIAYNDTLTNLPNKRFIHDKLADSIKEAMKENKRMAALLADVDDFKLVNDTLGHKIGDYILIEVAKRLVSATETEDVVYRVGGDKFGIILRNNLMVEDVEGTVSKITNLIKKPIKIGDKEVHITCSFGISLFYGKCTHLDTLIRNAEVAMYIAKDDGGNSYRFHDYTMDNKIVQKLEAKENIRLALNNREFILHYQPKVDTYTGQVVGLEALVRWQHPKLGLIYPNKFIPIAEEMGFAKEMDKYILELACLQIKEWITRGVKPINIAVNISAKLFNDKKFIEDLDEILEKTQIDPSCICIEITETAAMEDAEYACKLINELKGKRIKISLDDFGTGYSSLSYLKLFPIDILKIDRFFVDGITRDKRDESLIEAAITMAKALDVKVIAEGVETTEQLDFLKRNGCDEYQGYLFSKPIPIEELENLVKFEKEAASIK